MNRNLALRRTLDAIAHLSDREPPWTALCVGPPVRCGRGSHNAMRWHASGSTPLNRRSTVSVKPSAWPRRWAPCGALRAEPWSSSAGGTRCACVLAGSGIRASRYSAPCARRSRKHHRPVSRLSIPDDKGGLCRLELAPAVRQISLGKESLVFIRMHHDGMHLLPAVDHLCSAFGITLAEARVLKALMAGQSPKQHAGAQGVSVHTVRSQVASLMAKMECTRQVDLVRKGLFAQSPPLDTGRTQ